MDATLGAAPEPVALRGLLFSRERARRVVSAHLPTPHIEADPGNQPTPSSSRPARSRTPPHAFRRGERHFLLCGPAVVRSRPDFHPSRSRSRSALNRACRRARAPRSRRHQSDRRSATACCRRRPARHCPLMARGPPSGYSAGIESQAGDAACHRSDRTHVRWARLNRSGPAGAL